MTLGICVSLKNRSNLIVKQEDPIATYKFIANYIKPAPTHVEPPTTLPSGDIQLFLFPRMIASLQSIRKAGDDWHIIIVDYTSTDIDVGLFLQKALPDIPYTLITKNETFNRGGGLDAAAEAAKTMGIDSLFFCDSDMIFTEHHIFDQAYDALSKNKIYYPICFSYTTSKHTHGFWRDSGYGMVFMTTAMYFTTDRWRNNITWGWEDRALHDTLDPALVVRTRANGYYHQWHPNSSEFKTKEYAVKTYMGSSSAVPRVSKE